MYVCMYVCMYVHIADLGMQYVLLIASYLACFVEREC